MNVAEGARRMKYAGRWMVWFPLGALLVFVVFLAICSFVPGATHGFALYLQFLVLPLPLAFVGAALWIAGWITEGFAKDAE
jgi:uncharacterized membrane protein YhdT